MLAMNGGGNDRGGETGQRADLDDATRREDAHKSGDEEIIARTNPARMADIIPVDHGMEKIELAGRGNFPRATQLVGELPIFDFKLFEGFEFADIEISGGACRLMLLTKAPDFPGELEAAAARPGPNQIDIT